MNVYYTQKHRLKGIGQKSSFPDSKDNKQTNIGKDICPQVQLLSKANNCLRKFREIVVPPVEKVVVFLLPLCRFWTLIIFYTNPYKIR